MEAAVRIAATGGAPSMFPSNSAMSCIETAMLVGKLFVAACLVFHPVRRHKTDHRHKRLNPSGCRSDGGDCLRRNLIAPLLCATHRVSVMTGVPPGSSGPAPRHGGDRHPRHRNSCTDAARSRIADDICHAACRSLRPGHRHHTSCIHGAPTRCRRRHPVP
jgi:hypothetical protein